jgi:hypothetical protein
MGTDVFRDFHLEIENPHILLFGSTQRVLSGNAKGDEK